MPNAYCIVAVGKKIVCIRSSYHRFWWIWWWWWWWWWVQS